MSDLDAELLALAGDDESSDEEPQQTQVPTQGSPGEQGSDDEVAMDESDGDAPGDDAHEPEDSIQYPVEGKFKSQQDREHIMGLTEIEREQILAERADEAVRAEQKRKLAAIWSGYNKDNDKKRKADDGDDGDDRRSARTKTVISSARSKQLDEMKRLRAEKEGKKSSQSKPQRRSASPDADADADGESEGEWDDRPRRDQTPEEQPVTKRDFDRIKVGRNNFAMVCFFPGFEDAIRGCYVRVSIGPDPKKPGAVLYRMAKVEKIVEENPYAFPNKDGKLQITTQHVVASIGKGNKKAPFIHCSMAEFESSEVDFYLNRLKQDGLLAPKKTRLEAKTADLQALINHRFTNEELTAKLQRSTVLQDRFKEREKERLEKNKAEAEEVGETDKAQRIQEQIDNIDKNPVRLGYGTSMGGSSKSKIVETPKKADMTQQQRLAELNRQNRKADQDRIRKALIAENRAKDKRKAAAREAAGLAPEAVAENGEAVHNMFSSKDDLELPYPEWTFNYVEFSNLYLGSRAMQHLAFDDKGRAISEWPRELCDDEVIARMDVPVTCIVPEYD